MNSVSLTSLYLEFVYPIQSELAKVIVVYKLEMILDQ